MLMQLYFAAAAAEEPSLLHFLIPTRERGRDGEFHVTCEMLLSTAESVAKAVSISNICWRECYCESDLCYSQTAGSR